MQTTKLPTRPSRKARRAIAKALRLKGARFHFHVMSRVERLAHRFEVDHGSRAGESRNAKYEVDANYYCDLSRVFPYGAPEFDIPGCGALARNGLLLIRKGFRWDGPSGPAIDTADFLRGSCVHDLLYLAMRLGLISTGWRDEADAAMRAINESDGMWPPRAWWTFYGVRIFAGYAARPNERLVEKRRPRGGGREL